MGRLSGPAQGCGGAPSPRDCVVKPSEALARRPPSAASRGGCRRDAHLPSPVGQMHKQSVDPRDDRASDAWKSARMSIIVRAVARPQPAAGESESAWQSSDDRPCVVLDPVGYRPPVYARSRWIFFVETANVPGHVRVRLSCPEKKPDFFSIRRTLPPSFLPTTHHTLPSSWT